VLKSNIQEGGGFSAGVIALSTTVLQPLERLQEIH
jgi:hypothetical protein